MLAFIYIYICRARVKEVYSSDLWLNSLKDTYFTFIYISGCRARLKKYIQVFSG